MGSGYNNNHNADKGLFSHNVGGGHYPPYPPVAYPYPPPVGYPHGGYSSHGGYPPHAYPSHGAYPPTAYPASSTHCYSGHGGHKHGVGTFLAGGAAAVAASYGAHHMPHHGYGYGYGYHSHHHHHGKLKHYKFKRAKFGKRWKHGGFYGRHKMWK
ncbi:glycine-rich protein A3 [Artemisia annua]|uniref:Glycine-rich protein A3 n=1 Tax=Artemisia annua TaxID=35608 RepID=A0A2U1KW30_ARTAN|nr:glycine-rich protein A3 [Artemisia annua]